MISELATRPHIGPSIGHRTVRLLRSPTERERDPDSFYSCNGEKQPSCVHASANRRLKNSRVSHGAMRLSFLVGTVVVGLLCSTLAFHSLSGNRSSFSGSRMTSQHASIQYVGTVLRPQAELRVNDAPPPPVPIAAKDLPPPSPPPPLAALRATPEWMSPAKTYLAFNSPAKDTLARQQPHGTTIHFTFGSSVMMDFVKNWVHFIQKANLKPFLIGAADLPLLKACNGLSLPAAGIDPSLDVWTYQRKPGYGKEVYEMKSEWKYFRHHVRASRTSPAPAPSPRLTRTSLSS